jgi:hypothetical protein
LLRFVYGDIIRLIEPHLYGMTEKENEALLGWMVQSGQGSPIKEPAWRMFRTAELSSLTLTTGTFPGPRQGFNREDARFQRVFCSL